MNIVQKGLLLATFGALAGCSGVALNDQPESFETYLNDEKETANYFTANLGTHIVVDTQTSKATLIHFNMREKVLIDLGKDESGKPLQIKDTKAFMIYSQEVGMAGLNSSFVKQVKRYANPKSLIMVFKADVAGEINLLDKPSRLLQFREKLTGLECTVNTDLVEVRAPGFFQIAARCAPAVPR